MADTIEQTTPDAQPNGDAPITQPASVNEAEKTPVAPQQTKPVPGRFSQMQRAVQVPAKPAAAVVEPPVQEEPAPAATQVEDPRHATIDAKIKNPEVRQIIKSIAEKTPGVYVHFAFLFEYIDKMSAGMRVTDVDGIRLQTSLYRAVVGLLKNKEDNFNFGVVALLQVFQEHAEKCFNWDLINRFIEDHPMPKQDRVAFVGLTTMLTDLCTADIKERQTRAKKYMSPNNTARLQVAIGEDGLNRLRTVLRVN